MGQHGLVVAHILALDGVDAALAFRGVVCVGNHVVYASGYCFYLYLVEEHALYAGKRDGVFAIAFKVDVDVNPLSARHLEALYLVVAIRYGKCFVGASPCAHLAGKVYGTGGVERGCGGIAFGL